MSRASSLDVLKCLAAFFVVCIHYGADWLSPVVRCAVPMFFVITGYYYPMMVENGKFWKHIRKLLVMVVCASALYGAYELLPVIRHGGAFGEWLDAFQLERIVKLAIVNGPIFGFHLWYFFAVLYCLIILRLADKWGLTKWLQCAVPLLLLVHFARNFALFPESLVRNFLFMGLPCMMIGRCIRENKDGVFRFLSNRRYWWAYSFGSFLLACGEMLFFRIVYSDSGVREMYIFTLPMLLPCFYWALSHPRFGEGSTPATIGRKYSAYIYIFHVLAAQLLSHILKRDASLLARVVYPFLVFGISLCVSWLFVWFLHWAKSRPKATFC